MDPENAARCWWPLNTNVSLPSDFLTKNVTSNIITNKAVTTTACGNNQALQEQRTNQLSTNELSKRNLQSASPPTEQLENKVK